ncbi:MAG TPA: arylamine N-acetyltransferase [Bacteriovoracaceae bacterium]|nr:arylamine N-acetyltransferase [Bacteriovoracaceae bacterium]
MNLLLSDYFNRISYNKPPGPDLATLTELQELHTLAIPFENLTPFTGEEVSLAIETLGEKFLTRGRGGYCFEQNILFLEVLTQLGFKAKGLGARVLWNQPEGTRSRRSHMLLLIELERKFFVVDVGFGGLTLTRPLEFLIGVEQSTTHETFKIEDTGGEYELRAKVNNEWKTLYRFDLQEQYLADYEVMNYFLSTHRTSIFTNALIAARPFKGGRHALSNRQFTTYHLDGRLVRKDMASVGEVREVLTEIFQINLTGIDHLDQRLESFFR